MFSIIKNFVININLKKNKMTASDFYQLEMTKAMKIESKIQKIARQCNDCKNAIEKSRSYLKIQISNLTAETNKICNSFLLSNGNDTEELTMINVNNFKTGKLLWKAIENVKFCQRHSKKEDKIRELTKKVLLIEARAKLQEFEENKTQIKK
ncbi:hypothetical protein LT336_00020 [Spiroplasma sp. JKS002671]|uniref:hypothetical protein n=1 Tax=Spiroplasma attinicola TaxID=2904537 RepID=UPI002022ABC4|nr:hypothetical protein [Spiroplasma sp. JKS002671]MCL8210294.1 hypothetical protein [Spiroplasma sp. JKS002671]